jgi:hypothetical protein
MVIPKENQLSKKRNSSRSSALTEHHERIYGAGGCVGHHHGGDRVDPDCCVLGEVEEEGEMILNSEVSSPGNLGIQVASAILKFAADRKRPCL